MQTIFEKLQTGDPFFLLKGQSPEGTIGGQKYIKAGSKFAMLDKIPIFLSPNAKVFKITPQETRWQPKLDLPLNHDTSHLDNIDYDALNKQLETEYYQSVGEQ